MPPAKVIALLKDALGHHNAGRLDEADKLYRRVLMAAPNHFDALHLSGLVAYQQGRAREGADLLTRALKIDPKSAPCEMRLGLARVALGDLAAGERHFRGAVAKEPKLPEAWCHLGMVLKFTGRLAEARAAYDRALALKPDYGEAHDRLGALVADTEGFAAAVPHFRRAVALQPGHATGWANLGAALAQSGDKADALSCFARSLALDPANALALTGRALVFQETHRIPEAVAGYEEVVAKHPRNFEARSGKLLALHYLDGVSRERMFAEHCAFGTALEEAAAADARRFPNVPDKSRRLRIAFLSPDFRAHPIAYFMEPLLAHLDRSQFEIVLYHDHARVDAMSARLQAQAAVWRHFAGLPADTVEAAIRADAPDVLVDLAGHTGFNRLPLYARRLAPVQVTYLGYPDTTGLRSMDYRFVDAITDPPGDAEAFHTERLVRFAPTAWAFAPPLDAPEVAASMSGPVTFGCFNNFSKVSEATLRGWAGVLAAVPGSKLLLKGQGLADQAVIARFRERLAQVGVAEDRVELLGRTASLAAHLALYARVDVALDTYPYHGTTTTCEALWMGVPVVTLAGDRHMARVGASLLTAAGHPEWIARNWAEYAQIATRLAADRAELARVRAGLREEVRRSALLDHAAQAERFGAALRQCWEQWCCVQTLAKQV
jgi:protein O-GlcNAc transferase